ncbi:hypothetical protein A2U01_0026762, partial [Trifolium medium]|nr:hypothetical protein [Trifolium medium]
HQSRFTCHRHRRRFTILFSQSPLHLQNRPAAVLTQPQIHLSDPQDLVPTPPPPLAPPCLRKRAEKNL